MNDIQKIRVLISSPDGEFTDDELQMFLDLSSGSLFLGCALALDARAAGISTESQEVKIGDYSTSDRTRLATIVAQAQSFRDLEFNTPAFGVIEENLSDMNALIILRNYILRTEP
jgi:hypothetical protein